VDRAAIVAHLVSLAAGFAICLYLTRHQWFFNDEWEFFARMLPGRQLHLLVPHNEHWSTIPLLAYKALFTAFGLRSYIPYLVVLLCVHVLAAHLVWRTMRRVGVNIWIATVLCVAFLVMGGGDENIVSAFQISFVGSLVFGLAAMLLVERSGPFGPVRLAVSWLLLVGGLMCSGVGVTMVVTAGVVTMLRHGLRRALAVVSVPAVVYVAWFLAYGRSGLGVAPVDRQSLLMVPAYIWSGLTSAIEGFSGLVGFGGAAVIGIIVWAVWRKELAWAAALAVGGVAGAIVFYLIDAVGRSSLGVDQSVASRYVYISIALLLPAIGLILTSLARRNRIAQVAAFLLAAYVVAHCGTELVQGSEQWAQLKQTSKGQILAAAQLLESGTPLVGTQPDPKWAPQLTVSDLQEMQSLGDLPSAAGVSPQDLLTAESLLLLSVSAAGTPSTPASIHVAEGLGGRALSVAGGCVTVSSYGAPYTVTITFTTPGEATLTQDAADTEQTQLLDPGYPGVAGSRAIAYPASAAITVSKPGLTVLVSLPPESATICGLPPT
jgi:hypothetical protein